MIHTFTLATLLIATAGLSACTTARQDDLAVVEPTYSYIRDPSPTLGADATSLPTGTILSSDARPGSWQLDAPPWGSLFETTNNLLPWWTLATKTE